MNEIKINGRIVLKQAQHVRGIQITGYPMGPAGTILIPLENLAMTAAAFFDILSDMAADKQTCVLALASARADVTAEAVQAGIANVRHDLQALATAS